MCYRCISFSAWSNVWAEASLSDELHWYNGSFNPRQLDPQGTGSGCFHTTPVYAGGGKADWQASLWGQRNKIASNSSLWRGNMKGAWDAICRGKVLFIQTLVIYLFFLWIFQHETLVGFIAVFTSRLKAALLVYSCRIGRISLDVYHTVT